MSKTRIAVIGVGYLGKFHADKYAQHPDVELIAVCDVNQDTANAIAKKHKIKAVSDYRELLGLVDAVSIAVPTIMHHEIGKIFLENNVHVLIEKPITQTVAEASELIEIAKRNNLVFQVGHLERFNSATLALDGYLDDPRFIESNRLAPFNPRGTDVNVVLDLMIHDIDIIQSIIKSPIKHIDAHGAPILSEYIDIANARITFENGCVANVTASRISFKTERKTRIFQPNSYISIDFQNKKFAVFNKGEGEMFPGIPEINRKETVFEKSDSLLLEIKAFIHAVQTGTTPPVTGEDGRAALATAQEISRMIRANITDYKQKLETV